LKFFGAPARLNTPATPPDRAKPTLFASAVLRPGYESILLRVNSLDRDAETGDADWQQAARIAEAVVREFPLQWWCDRQLWPGPAEQTLPEFTTSGNRAATCGR
jgi:hypothetical protein